MNTMKTFAIALVLVALSASSSSGAQGATRSLSSERSFRPKFKDQCGALALAQVIQTVMPEGSARTVAALLAQPVPEGGFSLDKLARMSGDAGFLMQAVHRVRGDEVPVPSVVHYWPGHFSAITKRMGAKYLVYDTRLPLGSAWLDAQQINRQSSGYFLTPGRHSLDAWAPVSSTEERAVRGAFCYVSLFCDDLDWACDREEDADSTPIDPNSPADKEPNPLCRSLACDISGTGDGLCEGMGTWAVSEPFGSLWIKDRPLFYTMSNGRVMSLKLFYNQNNSPQSPDQPDRTDIFSFGNHWKSSWASYVACTNGDLQLRIPGAGSRTYSGSYASWAPDLHSATAAYMTGNGVVSEVFPIQVHFVSGSTNNYGYHFSSGTGCSDLFFLTEKVDHAGRVMRFKYQTTNGVVRLTNIVDFDGKSISLRYTNAAAPQLVTSVEDPYQRIASFSYDASGNLTNITDMAGLASGFAYGGDSGFSLIRMVTPYGMTQFQEANRSVLVTLPNGSHELFAYRDSCDWMSSSYGATVAPSGYLAVDNEAMNLHNSFHWTASQYARLSSTNLAAFQPSDFGKARLKHWLLPTTPDYPTRPPVLSLVREASPNAFRVFKDASGG
jgi:YD repeat-containing protein